jgi:hypothetical protein
MMRLNEQGSSISQSWPEERTMSALDLGRENPVL